jgi:CRP-like cAMP-binding protein
MNEQYAALIAQFPLFQGLTLNGAQMLLDRGEVKEFSAGEMIVEEGDNPTVVLLLLTGAMQIFVERRGRDLIIGNAEPGTLLGELGVLCGIPRSASVRATAKSAALQWSAAMFRTLLLQNLFLSERIFRESLRTVIEKEKALIDELTASQDNDG